MQAEPNHPQNAKGLYCSFQQWHSQRLGCVGLSNPYEQEWWQHTPLPESNTNCERFWYSSSDTDKNFGAGIKWLDGRQHPPRWVSTSFV